MKHYKLVLHSIFEKNKAKLLKSLAVSLLFVSIFSFLPPVRKNALLFWYGGGEDIINFVSLTMKLSIITLLIAQTGFVIESYSDGSQYYIVSRLNKMKYYNVSFCLFIVLNTVFYTLLVNIYFISINGYFNLLFSNWLMFTLIESMSNVILMLLFFYLTAIKNKKNSLLFIYLLLFANVFNIIPIPLNITLLNVARLYLIRAIRPNLAITLVISLVLLFLMFKNLDKEKYLC